MPRHAFSERIADRTVAITAAAFVDVPEFAALVPDKKASRYRGSLRTNREKQKREKKNWGEDPQAESFCHVAGTQSLADLAAEVKALRIDRINKIYI
jgi:hypothetical protein